MKKILLIFFIIIGFYIIFTNAWELNWFSFGNQETRAEVTNKIETIVLDVSSVSTTIIPEDRNDLEVNLKGKGKVSVDKKRNQITVKVERKWFEWFSFSKQPDLTIYIPNDYHQNLDFDIGSGNIEFAGESRDQPMELSKLTIDMSSGNLNLKNINVDYFEHDGSSGNVNIDSLSANTGVVDISSGNLDIKRYRGAFKADLSSGKLNLQIDELIDTIDIDVSSGKVDVDLPKDADFTLTGKSSSGNISCEFPLTSDVVNNKTIKGTHGTGEHEINLDISSGTIKIH